MIDVVDLNCLHASHLSESAILAPLNASVRDINNMALGRLRGRLKLYQSTDEELDGEGNIVTDMPPEILNSIYRPGLPVHNLQLKVQALVRCLSCRCNMMNSMSGPCGGSVLGEGLEEATTLRLQYALITMPPVAFVYLLVGL